MGAAVGTSSVLSWEEVRAAVWLEAGWAHEVEVWAREEGKRPVSCSTPRQLRSLYCAPVHGMPHLSSERARERRGGRIDATAEGVDDDAAATPIA